jgi:Immunity protein 10
MATILKYNFVISDEEDNVLTVGFADAPFKTQEYLLFQNCSDVESEDNDVYIERDDQSQGTCGGIQQFILFSNHALLLLSLETAKIIDTEQEVNILFSATDVQFQQLKSGLGIVFAGKSCLEVHS